MASVDDKPWLLDLFSGGGAGADGYRQAGYVPVGVDIIDQSRYPSEFWQDDALAVLDKLLAGERWHGYRLMDFDAIHASPVCKGYSQAHNIQGGDYPLLIEPTRQRLRRTGLPWVLKNVRMTGKWRGHMPSAIVLCGTHFGLKVYRHRYFESSELLFAPGPCTHPAALMDGYVCIYGHHVRGRQTGNRGNHYTRYGVEVGLAAMGIDRYMTQVELSQAIPPAYTRWIGQQLLPVVTQARRATA